MRMLSFSSAFFVAGVLCLAACEPDDNSGSPGLPPVQNPGQTAYDAAVVGPGFDTGTGVPRSDAGGGLGAGSSDAGGSVTPLDAHVPDAAVGDAGPVSDAGRSDAGVQGDAGAVGYSPCPATGPCKILPLGDSITYGLDSTSTSPSTGSYRVELFRKARVANKNITFVGSLHYGPDNLPDGTPFPSANEGHSGWTISQVTDLVPSPALQDKPHITLLMIGTNDMSYGDLGAALGFGDLAGAPTRLGMLIDELVGSDANMLVVVAQLTPRSSGNDDTEAYNRALPAEVASRASQGKHVVLVDMYTGFPSDGLSDFVHPNKKGYDWMAGVWYKAIEPVLR